VRVAPELYFTNRQTKGSLLPGARRHKYRIPPASSTPSAAAAIFITQKPRAVSLTQATEVGTVYSVAEIQTICGVAHAAACASTWMARASPMLSPPSASRPRQSLGGWRGRAEFSAAPRTGLAVGEAVVFFNREPGPRIRLRCKQGGQLASKMRFLSAPWVGMLRDGAWLRPPLTQRHGPSPRKPHSRLAGTSPSPSPCKPTPSSPPFQTRLSTSFSVAVGNFYTNVGVDYAA